MARKQVKPDQIRVRVLGATELQIGSRRVGMNTEALFALGLYLTTRAGERIAREEILEIFWPEGAAESRRHAMRQMMYRLRQKGLELDEDGESLRLDPAHVASDLRDCLQADWPERAGAAAVEAALALGPTFSARLAAPFLDWFDGVRAEVAAQHRKAAAKQITLARREGRWSDVERWARAALQSDPLNEEATLARAESAAMSGSKVAALEILDTYLAEIGQVAPELGKPAVVLRKRIAEKRADWRPRGPTEVEMVGRSTLLGSISSVLDAELPRESNCIVLVGPPGIGKTRLASEALQFAALGGCKTLTIRAQKDHRDRPLSCALAVVQALLDFPGALATDPPRLEVLKAIAANPALSHDQALDLFNQSSLVESFAALATSISGVVRSAILVDDGHNVDDPSRNLMESFIRRTASLRIVWIVTSRSTGIRWTPSNDVRVVPPLTISDAERLAELTLTSSGGAHNPKGCLSLAKATGGNPLFLRESAAHGLTSDKGEFRVPPTLRDTIRARLSALDEQAYRLVRCITLLGRCASVERCGAMIDGGLPALSIRVERLELEGIVYLGSSQTLSLHECWQQEVLASLPEATTASLALECARAIGNALEAPLSLEELWTAGNLYAKAGVHREALSCLLTAADHLSVAGAYKESLETLEQAAALAQSEWHSLSVARRIAELKLFRGSIYDALLCLSNVPLINPPEGRSDRELTDWALCVALRADATQKLAKPFAVEEAALFEIVRSTRMPVGARLNAGVVGAKLAARRADFARLGELRRFAIEAENSHGPSLPSGLIQLISAAEDGTELEVCEVSQTLMVLEGMDASRSARSHSMRYRAVGLRMAGRVSEAICAATLAFDQARAFDNFETTANCAEFLAFTYLDENEPDLAEKWLELSVLEGHGLHNPLRSIGLRHARNRLRQSRGQHEAVVEDMRPRLGAFREDSLMPRRAGELLTFCVSQLQIDSSDEAVQSVALEISKELLKDRPSFSIDYPAEMAARALSYFAPDEAERFMKSYRVERRRCFNRPLASFYNRLNASGDFRPSNFRSA